MPIHVRAGRCQGKADSKPAHEAAKLGYNAPHKNQFRPEETTMATFVTTMHFTEQGIMPEFYLELEEKLRPLADPLPRPRPGDWLAEHDEPGQTFAEYLDARPVRKSDKLHTIYLCLVGEFTEAQRRILDLTQGYLTIFFDCPVQLQRHIALASIPKAAGTSGR
jgi:hypothetical protein